jgi:hypothetical protein
MERRLPAQRVKKDYEKKKAGSVLHPLEKSGTDRAKVIDYSADSCESQ